MSAVQVNEPTKRAKFEKDDGFVTVRVAKESGDDQQNPDAMIHRLVGEDGDFPGAVIDKETPRNIMVKIPKAEAHAYKKGAEDQAKAMVAARSGIKGVSLDKTQEKGGVDLNSIIREAKNQVLKELSDANG